MKKWNREEAERLLKLYAAAQPAPESTFSMPPGAEELVGMVADLVGGGPRCRWSPCGRPVGYVVRPSKAKHCCPSCVTKDHRDRSRAAKESAAQRAHRLALPVCVECLAEFPKRMGAGAPPKFCSKAHGKAFRARSQEDRERMEHDARIVSIRLHTRRQREEEAGTAVPVTAPVASSDAPQTEVTRDDG